MVSKKNSGKTAKPVKSGAAISGGVQRSSPEFFLYLVLAWLVVMAGLFSLPNYNMLLPQGNPFSGLPTRWVLIAGFLALVFLWKLLPPVPENASDLPKWPVRVFFWAFMVLGFILRMRHPERPMGFFWDDHYVVI